MKFLKIISISFMVFILFYAIDNIITQKERSILYTGFPHKGKQNRTDRSFFFFMPARNSESGPTLDRSISNQDDEHLSP